MMRGTPLVDCPDCGMVRDGMKGKGAFVVRDGIVGSTLRDCLGKEGKGGIVGKGGNVGKKGWTFRNVAPPCGPPPPTPWPGTQACGKGSMAEQQLWQEQYGSIAAKASLAAARAVWQSSNWGNRLGGSDSDKSKSSRPY
jgi:hypothetical protein